MTDQNIFIKGMIIAVIATNVGSNSLPVGADISGLLPRYINIVRGQVFCALMAPLCIPWKIIATATTFLTFLSSYTVFLMPICGVSHLGPHHISFPAYICTPPWKRSQV